MSRERVHCFKPSDGKAATLSEKERHKGIDNETYLLVKNETEGNKVGYTAIPVTDGWAGAEMRIFTLTNLITPDRQIDQQTNRQTGEASYKAVCPQLKMRSSVETQTDFETGS